MNLQTFTHDHLLSEFENLVRSERKITHQVLRYINEIERRQLHLERAYPSLFEFLVRGFGYSAGAAMRRIDGARLLKEIPEVAQKIEEGSLNLSQVSQIQRAVRELKKTDNRTVPLAEKRELLLKIANTSQKRSEQIIAESLNLPIPTPVQKETTHRDESVTLSITFTKEQMGLLEKAQQVISHCVPNRNWAEAIAYLAEKEVRRRERGALPRKKSDGLRDVVTQSYLRAAENSNAGTPLIGIAFLQEQK